MTFSQKVSAYDHTRMDAGFNNADSGRNRLSMASSCMDFTLDEFEKLRTVIYKKTGISLESKKIDFVYRRISRRMEMLNIESPLQYINYIKFLDPDGVEFQQLINLITINETYFFRDFPQLQAFGESALQDRIEKKNKENDKSLRIWSAGCSTGEEPYTIAIILLEMIDNIRDWNLEILASDIDVDVLTKCRLGIYGRRSVNEVPPTYLTRYFHKNSNGTYHVKNAVKELVNFEHLNIGDREELRKRKGYDFIFCRNVLIYFDDESRKNIIDHFYFSLKKGGYIFLGSAESIGRLVAHYKVKRVNNHFLYYKE